MLLLGSIRWWLGQRTDGQEKEEAVGKGHGIAVLPWWFLLFDFFGAEEALPVFCRRLGVVGCHFSCMRVDECISPADYRF